MKRIVTGLLPILMLLGLLFSCQADSGSKTEEVPVVEESVATDTTAEVPQDTTQVAPE